jgi:hypothetical protein
MKASTLSVLVLALAMGCAGSSPKGDQGIGDQSAGNGGLNGPGNGNGGTGSDTSSGNGSAAGSGGNDAAANGGNGGGSNGGAGGSSSGGSNGGAGGSSGGGNGGAGGSNGGGGSAGHSGSGGGSAGHGGSGGGSNGGAGTGGSGGSSGGAGSGGTGGSGGPLTRAEFCMGKGPVVTVPGFNGGQPLCTGTIASQLFTSAVCTCEDTNFAGYLLTRSFSGNAGSQPVAQGAPVGVNGDLLSGSYVDAGGSLRVQGGTAFAGYLNVGGDLMLEQDVTLLGDLTVTRDAWFQNDANITAGGIGRDLHTQAGNVEPPFWFSVGGTRTQSTFDLDTPCLCDAPHLLDIDAIVDDGQAHNDNADPSVQLDPASLTNLIGYNHVDLPCGRFYVDEISGAGELDLHVTGRTALFVGGDVAVTGYLNVTVDPNAELDLFVRGNMLQIGYGKFGNQAHPASVRVYVGGDADILYLGYQPFAGNLYAPKARLWSAGYIDVAGSLFAREIDAGDFLHVQYDTDILTQPDECEPPPDEPPMCKETCQTGCGTSQACVDGTCGKCTKDSDCCAPLICYADGTCGELQY